MSGDVQPNSRTLVDYRGASSMTHEMIVMCIVCISIDWFLFRHLCPSPLPPVPILVPAAVLSHPSQDLVHVRSSVIIHYVSIAQSRTMSADEPMNSSNAQAKLSPASCCLSPCSARRTAIVCYSTAGVS
ncbi:hypothetical protein M405DRAFT_217984 [Rhizopogon salebrosus TDB-379]|nr:hypothetical protein M405DRAFT_217984 [Rhizopogon salebrosus TDB-379]